MNFRALAVYSLKTEIIGCVYGDAACRQMPVTMKDSGWAWSPFRDWTRLEGVVQRSRCRRGLVLYSAGQPSDSVFMLKTGRVKIVRVRSGGKGVILHLVEPGEIFGEMCLFGEPYRENSAEVTEEALLWVIPRRPLVEWLRPRPEAWEAISTLLSRRLRTVQANVERLLFWDVEQRVIRLLLDLGAHYGEPSADGLTLKVVLSQKELAEMIGSTRETVSTTLNRLSKDGLVRIRRRRVSICSMAELSGLALRALPPRIPPQIEGARRLALAKPAGADGV